MARRRCPWHKSEGAYFSACTLLIDPRRGPGLQMTANEAHVTCKNCLRILAKRRKRAVK